MTYMYNLTPYLFFFFHCKQLLFSYIHSVTHMPYVPAGQKNPRILIPQNPYRWDAIFPVKFAFSIRETLWKFIGHSVLLGELLHRTELISVWLWVYIVYIVYIVLEATSDISVRLEMRQIGPITYLSCRSVGPMNLADTGFVPELLWPVKCTAFSDFWTGQIAIKTIITRSGNRESCIPYLPDTFTRMWWSVYRQSLATAKGIIFCKQLFNFITQAK